MCVCVSVCMYVCMCATCLSVTSRCQKKAPNSLELELKMPVSHHMGDGNGAWSSARTASAPSAELSRLFSTADNILKLTGAFICTLNRVRNHQSFRQKTCAENIRYVRFKK